MSTIQYAFLGVSFIVLVIGFLGYTNKKWSLEVFLYVYTITAVFCFVMGVFPTRYKDSTLIRQIFTATVISIASAVNILVILKIVEKLRKMNR